MITLQSNADKYSILYKDAWNTLNEAGKADENFLLAFPDQDSITCLEDYFSVIGLLSELHTTTVNSTLGLGTTTVYNNNFSEFSRFLMMPLEEEYFKIDANSRTINIPSTYVKNGVGVTGDQIAETLLFEVDRYFDYTDLVNTTIYVQWTNPIGEDGASLITLVDYDEKKIRFGWHLTDKITKGNGKLEFAIRFILRENGSPDVNDPIVYSLNTLPATVLIRSTLEKNIESGVNIDQPSDLLAAAIKNGTNTRKTQPLIPSFIESPDSLLYFNDSALEQDIVLTSQAYAADAGKITYAWKYSDSLGGPTRTLPSEEEYVQTEDTSRQTNKRYYIEESANNYSIYSGAIDVGANGKGVSAEDNDIPVYELRSKCVIDSTEETITGKYTIVATNTVSINTRECAKEFYIPGPDAIEFETNLSNNGNVLEPAADLSVTIKDDLGNKDNETFQWQVSTTSSESGFTDIPDAVSSSYTADNIGWYKVLVTRELNKDSISNVSEVARVTRPPEVPQIEDPSVGGEGILVNPNANIAKFDIEVINSHPDAPSALYSDKYLYTWRYKISDDPSPNTEYDISTEDNGVEIDENNGTLTIDITLFDAPRSKSYVCYVVNELNGEFSTAAKSEWYYIG